MSHLAQVAKQDYNTQIETVKSLSIQKNETTIVSTVKCGSSVQGGVEREVTLANVHYVSPLSTYDCPGMTPLFDSVGALIEDFEKVPVGPETAFLIIAITDGFENASHKWSKESLAAKIRTLQATDRWTFVFRVPYGHKNNIVHMLGLRDGNVQEWAQTEAGLKMSSYDTVGSTQSYYEAKSQGVGSRAFMNASTSFYTNMNDVKRTDIKKALWDVTSQVQFYGVPPKADKEQIKPFLEGAIGKAITIGSAFYPLTKPERIVQDNKLIAIRDKKTSKVYSGPKVRDLLKLPTSGKVKVSPGNHGEYELYIQSKSTNRQLVGGTQVMHWNNVGDPTASFQKAQPYLYEKKA